MVMLVIYSPLLFITAFLERQEAERVRWNRGRGEQDDDQVEEWEELGMETEIEGDIEADADGDNVGGTEDAGNNGAADGEHGEGSKKSWKATVMSVKPDVETEAAVLEVRKLREELQAVKELVQRGT